jgi:oxygen-independent coproporphyrinogen-3 oxidase
MKLYFKGHDYKYAAEQVLLMMFPGERPEYPDDGAPGDGSVTITLSRAEKYTTAHARLLARGRRADGFARVENSSLNGKLLSDRNKQKIIKLAFYKAAVEITGIRPPWGALTGIRPGKMVTDLLSEGLSEEQALRFMEQKYFASPERLRLCLYTAKAGMSVRDSLDKRDVALYIGIPFCPTRCAYCSFVSSSVEKSMGLITPFIDTLRLEMAETAAAVKRLGLRVVAVYFGGGTPTTLSPRQLETVMDALSSDFDLSPVREYTVEAGRPDTITGEKLSVLKSRGVTRISINPQTMSDSVLRAIGRNHSSEDVLTAYSAARASGIGSVNMDLIAGLPSDDHGSFCRSLDSVLALSPENITVHTLALKKGSRITLDGTDIPGGAEVGKMLDTADSALFAAGYRPYYLYRQKYISGGFENVGWAKPGAESLYNICIMEELCSILAMGGGGSTKLVAPASGRIERIYDPKYPLEYIKHADKFRDDKKKIDEFYINEVL